MDISCGEFHYRNSEHLFSRSISENFEKFLNLNQDSDTQQQKYRNHVKHLRECRQAYLQKFKKQLDAVDNIQLILSHKRYKISYIIYNKIYLRNV
jgi:hypothetical protein